MFEEVGGERGTEAEHEADWYGGGCVVVAAVRALVRSAHLAHVQVEEVVGRVERRVVHA